MYCVCVCVCFIWRRNSSDVPVVNLGLDTKYSLVFSYFSSVDQANAATVHRIGHDDFIQALSISLVTNQTAAVFGNIANCPFSVKNIRYLLVLSTLPDISGNVLKYRANLLYTVIIKSFGKSPTTLVTPVLSWTLTQELGPSIHWQVTYQFPETQATVDVNNFLFRSFHCIVCTWQSIWPEQANGYMERNIVFKRKVSFYCFRVVFINRSLELLARYLVSLVII